MKRFSRFLNLSTFLFTTFFLTLSGTFAQAATEDFTTYIENDPTSTITTTANCIAFNSIQSRNSDSYVYKDHTSFTDFEHTFDTILTSSNAASGSTIVWGVSDTSADTFEDWTNGIALGWYRNSGSVYRLDLIQVAGGTLTFPQLSVGLSVNTRYYVEVSRSGNDVTAKIFSDAAKTTLVDTLTATVTIPSTLQYVYGVSTRTLSGYPGRNQSGDSCNLEITYPPQTFDITWTDMVNVSLDGNNDITKTSASGNFGAGAASVESFAGDGGIIFTSTSISDHKMIGVSTDNPDQYDTTIDYAVYLAPGGDLRGYENGTSLGSLGSYVSGDEFSIERVGTTIYFKKNGSTVYTSATASTGSLLTDVSIYTSGAKIEGVQIFGIDQRAEIQSHVPNITLTESAPTFSWSSGYGVTEYRLGVATSAALLDTTGDVYDQNQGTSTSVAVTGLPINNNDLYVRLWSKIAGIWEYKDYTFGTRDANDITWTDMVNVSLDGNNDITKTSASGNFGAGAASVESFAGDGGIIFTSTSISDHKLIGVSTSNPDQYDNTIDYAIYLAPGGDLRGYESGTSLGSFGSYASGDQFMIERVGTTIYFKKNGSTVYTSSTASTGALLTDVSIYTSGAKIEGVQLFSMDHPAEIQSPIPNSIFTESSQTFSWSTGHGVTEYRLGIATSAALLDTTGDVYDQNQGTSTSIAVTGLPINNNNLYVRLWSRIAGVWEYNDYTFETREVYDIAWTDMVNVSLDGNNDITKTSASGNFGAGAASVESFAGDGGIIFTSTSIADHKLIGVSTSNPDQYDNTIEYAIYLAPGGDLRGYESGTSLGSFGSYASGDQFMIERVGTTIYFKKNGSTVYTSATASTGSLLTDVSIYTSGAEVEGVQIFGIDQRAEIQSPALNSILTESSQTISWSSGYGVTEYRLGIATSAALLDTTGDVYDQNQGTSTSVAVTGLPINNNALYMRLWSRISGVWEYKDYTFETLVAYDVTWTDLVGASATGNDLTNTVSGGWGSSGAASTQFFVGDGGVRATTSVTNAYSIIGLSNENTDAGIATIDYGFNFRDGGIYYVTENGSWVTSSITFQAGDIFTVERVGSTVEYRQNGTLVYTNTAASSDPLLVDAAFSTAVGATLEDVMFVNVDHRALIESPSSNAPLTDSTQTFTWSSGFDVTEYRLGIATSATLLDTTGDIYDQNQGTATSVNVTGLPINNNDLYVRLWSKKDGTWSYRDYTYQTIVSYDVTWTDLVGASATGNDLSSTTSGGWGTSGAASTQSFTGDGGVRSTAAETNTYRISGLSNENTDAGIATIDYGFNFRDGGIYYVTENGTWVTSSISFQTGDVFTVDRVGTTIEYRQNGTLVYTNTAASSDPLLVDAAFSSAVGATLEDVMFINVDQRAFIETPPVISPLTESTQTFTWASGFDVTEYRLGIATSAALLDTTGDVFDQNLGTALTANVTGIPINNSDLYLRLWSKIDGAWSYRDYTYQTAVAYDIDWTELVNTTASAGTLTKSTSANYWDAGAASIQVIPGNGGVSFTATNTTDNKMLGLSASNTDAGYTNINYALYLSPSGYYVYENGANTYSLAGGYSSGDVVSVERIGTTVYFKKNDSIMYASTVASSGNLIADASIFTGNASLNDTKIYGIEQRAQITAPVVGSTLLDTALTFDWTAGYDVTEYRLGIATSAALLDTTGDVYDQNLGAALTANVTGLPIDNNTLYVRLWSRIAGVWQYIDYTYTTKVNFIPIWRDAVGATASGTTVTKTAATDTWDAGAASIQYLTGDGGIEFTFPGTFAHRMIGLSQVSFDENYPSIEYAIYPTPTGAIYLYEKGVSLGSQETYQVGDIFSIERVGTTVTYLKNDVVFYTSTAASTGNLLIDTTLYNQNTGVEDIRFIKVADRKASLLAPTEGNYVTEETSLFEWTPGFGVEEYRLGVATSAALLATTGDIYDQNLGTATSVNVASIPLNSTTIYARLWSKIDGAWVYTDYSFETRLSSEIAWTDLHTALVDKNTLIHNNINNSWYPGAATTQSFSGDGGISFTADDSSKWMMVGLSTTNAGYGYTTIHYALYTHNGDVYVYENGTYVGGQQWGTYQAGDRLAVERIGSTVYYKVNGRRIYTSTVSSSGSLLGDVSMYTMGGKILDVKMYGQAPEAAILYNPQLTQNIMLENYNFEWSTGVDVSEYRLAIATTAALLDTGADIFDQNTGTNKSVVATGIPLTGSPIYVRLYSNVSGTWQHNDYTINTGTAIPLTMGQLYGRSNVPSGTVIDIYTFDADASDVLHIPVLSTVVGCSCSLSVRLFDPNGLEVTVGSSAGYPTVTVNDTGKYTMWVTKTGNPTHYNLTLQRSNNPAGSVTLTHGSSYSSSINPETNLDAFTFVANANDTIKIPFAGTTISSNYHLTLTLYNDSGVELTSVANVDSATLTHTAPYSGTYHLLLRAHNLSGVGNYDIELIENLLTDVGTSAEGFMPLDGATISINYTLDNTSDVTIKIYDISDTNVTGRTLIATPVNAVTQNAGVHTFNWDGYNDSASLMPMGTYMYTVEAVGATRTVVYDPTYVDGSVDILNSATDPNFAPFQSVPMTMTFDLSHPAWMTMQVGVENSINEDATVMTSRPMLTTGNTVKWNGVSGVDGNGTFQPMYAEAFGTTAPSTKRGSGITIKRKPKNSFSTDIKYMAAMPQFHMNANPWGVFTVYEERTTIIVSHWRKAYLDVWIETPSGAHFRTLVSNEYNGGSQYDKSIIWDGLNDAGYYPSEQGAYMIKVKETYNSGYHYTYIGGVVVFDNEAN